MLIAITQFDQSFTNIVSITFTTLICIEMLNVLTSVTKIKPMMIFSILFTLLIYFLSIILFRGYFAVAYIDGTFILKVGILTMICWLPIHIFKKIMQKCDPTQEQKIMKEAL
jgi:phospholipid-translocating ATPase